MSASGLRRAGGCLLAGVGLAWLLSGCQPTPEQLRQRADAAIADGEPRTAAIHLKSLLQLQPDDGAARATLGRVEFVLGDAEGAAKELRRAIELGVKAPEIRLVLVEALLAQRDYAQALQTLGDLPDAADVDFRVLMLAGRAEEGAGAIAAAEARYRAAMAAAPGQAAPVVATAALMFKSGRMDEGDTLLAAALKLDANDIPARILRGRRIAALQGAAAAASDLRATLALASRPADQADVLAPLAEAEFAAGDRAAAAQSVGQLRKIAPGAPLTRYLGARLQAESGDYAAAILSLQRLLRDVPDFAVAERLLGTVHYLDGNFEQAAMHLSRVMAGSGADPFLVRLLAELRIRQNRPQEALQALLPIIRQGPGAVFDQRLLGLAGEASLRLGDSDAAIRYFRQGSAANPGDARLRLGEISARLASGDVTAARAMLAEMPAAPETRLAVDYLSVMAALLEGRGGEAQGIADRLVAEHSGAAWAQMLAATVHLWQGEDAPARSGFEAALRLEPGNREALLNLARLDLREGAGDLARERLRKVIAAEPGDFRPRIMLAEAELSAGHADAALAEGRAAVQVAADSPEALNLLGRMAAAAGRLDEARNAFLRVTAIDPRNARAWLNLGRVTATSGDDGTTQQAIDTALRLAPGDAAVLLAAGDILLSSGKAAAALPLFERSFVLEPGAAAAMRSCRARIALNRQPPCELLAGWVARHPADVAARLFKASIHRQLGDTHAAVAEYEGLLAAVTDQPVALNNLAWLYFEAGDARAETLARRALEVQPRSAEAMDTLGWIRLQQGDRKGGHELIAAAARGSPGDPEIQYHLAWALNATGDAAAARRTLAALLASAPSFPSRGAAEALQQRLGTAAGGAG